MLKDGIFEKYKPEVAIGWHAWASLNTGEIGYRSRPVHGGFAGLEDRGERQADARLASVAGRRSHRRRPRRSSMRCRPWSAARSIITRISPRCSRWASSRAASATTSSPTGRDDRHDAHVHRRRMKQQIFDDHEAHGGENRRGQRRHREVRARQLQQPGDVQRPEAHGARVAQSAQGGGRQRT